MTSVLSESAGDSVWVFLDETQRTLSRPGRDLTLTAVAGIVLAESDRANTEQAIVDLHADILADPQFWYDPNPYRKESFRRSMHATEMNESVRMHALEKISRLPFRIYVAHSVHLPSEDKIERYALLYHSILRKMIRRYSQQTINFVFEQHSDMDQHFETFVRSAALISEDIRPIEPYGSQIPSSRPTERQNKIAVARGDKTAPGCAIADVILYTFGDAVLAGLLDFRGSAGLAQPHIIRRWTHQLAARIAYEYDYDRDAHHSGRKARRQVESF